MKQPRPTIEALLTRSDVEFYQWLASLSDEELMAVYVATTERANEDAIHRHRDHSEISRKAWRTRRRLLKARGVVK